MVNWMDPARIAEDAAIFSKLMLVCIGIIGWEIIVTFPYDWTILSGKRKFKYPMGFYFACRYSLFFSLIGMTDNRDLPGGKDYESDVDETGSESENGNGAVRYTRSERAQVKLPEAPRVGFTQDLTTKAQNANDEKR
ncbi:hypothetical protein FRC00_007268 [Tulasnella sp. 408]|nr:hypothetical protein FRC00_007268 [Tulasnella sp. 408]